MPKFSARSLEKLKGVHPQLVAVAQAVIEKFDFAVICGVRSLEEQKILFDAGRSKTLDSKHLVQADGFSHAIDIAPYPVNWNDAKPFYFLAGLMLATAEHLGYSIRWGGDWNRNYVLSDQTFFDLPHFELVA